MEVRIRMKSFRLLTAIVLMSMPFAARAQDVNVNHAPGVDFTRFKTYSWAVGRPASSPQMHKLIIEAIDDELQSKGLRRTEEKGDLVVTYYASLDANINTSAVEYVKNSDWHKWGDHEPVYGPKMVAMPIARMTLDIIDASANKLIWRGRAKDAYTPNQARGKRRVQKAVKKLFVRFPPTSVR